MKPIIVYFTTGAIFSTIKSKDGNGCMLESGEPNLPELYGQINTVKPLGARGCSNFPEWLKSRKDRNCSTFAFADYKDKFTLRIFNPQRKKSEEIVIKSWCGEDKKDEFEAVLFDACLAKPKHRTWNPWYRNVDGVRGWHVMNEKTTAIRHAFIDEKLSLWIPLIKQGYKIKIRVANEPPKEAVPAVNDSLEYLIDKLRAAGFSKSKLWSFITRKPNIYKTLVPGVQRVPEVEQTKFNPYRIYKNWRKKRGRKPPFDEMALETMRETVHQWPDSSYCKMIMEDNQNVSGNPAVNMSLDGVYYKIGEKEYYPGANMVYDYFYPLFRKIKDVGKKYKRILKNNWIIEVLGWGTNFKGGNVKGITDAYLDVFGVDITRPDFKKLEIPKPEPKPEPEPDKPTKPEQEPKQPEKPKEADMNFFKKTWAWLNDNPKFSWWVIGVITPFIVWLLTVIF
jgi:hypothetical protein